MRVRMIKTLSNVREIFLENEEYEIPDGTARQWLGANVATDVAIPPIAMNADAKPLMDAVAATSRNLKKLRRAAK